MKKTLLLCALGLACSDPGGPNPGLPDMGVDGGPPAPPPPPPVDAGPQPDAAPGTDAGFSPCDPYTGDGCPSGEFCYILQNGVTGNTQLTCTSSTGSKGQDDPCNPNLVECSPGLNCLFQEFGSVSAPRCRRICDGGGDENACNLTAGPNPVYACFAFGAGPYDSLGGCIGGCDPLTDPAGSLGCGISTFPGWLCSAGQPILTCQPPGSVGIGDSCLQDFCEPGGVCVVTSTTGEQFCLEPCALDNPQCSDPNTACEPFLSLVTPVPYGGCLPQ